MLSPNARAVLLDQLRPPVGYQLDAAVATTFTLDLAAALVPSLAFASFQLSRTTDPVAALEAVRSCADRLDIFCQAGQVTIPAQASALMAFLEPMVHEVRRPRPGRLFHPKIWFLRYSNEELGTTYRLLCLTRNLTAAHSWDAILRLDGALGTRRRASNRPLVDLLRALSGLCVTPMVKERRARIDSLAEDARHIAWELPDDVNELSFHALGITGTAAPDFSGYRHLAIAPFVTDDGLAIVAPASPNVTVISRSEDLDRLSPETAARVQAYTISPLAGLAETGQDDSPASDDVLFGLHAKIYVVERNRRAHVFVGSANATAAAFGGNVEFLIEMVGGATKLGVNTFLEDDAPFRTLLEQYDAKGAPPPIRSTSSCAPCSISYGIWPRRRSQQRCR